MLSCRSDPAAEPLWVRICPAERRPLARRRQGCRYSPKAKYPDKRKIQGTSIEVPVYCYPVGRTQRRSRYGCASAPQSDVRSRDDGKGQDIRRQRNTRTNSEDNKAPHPRCQFIVILSVEPSGGAAMGAHLSRRATPAREAAARVQIFAKGEIPGQTEDPRHLNRGAGLLLSCRSGPAAEPLWVRICPAERRPLARRRQGCRYSPEAK